MKKLTIVGVLTATLMVGSVYGQSLRVTSYYFDKNKPVTKTAFDKVSEESFYMYKADHCRPQYRDYDCDSYLGCKTKKISEERRWNYLRAFFLSTATVRAGSGDFKKEVEIRKTWFDYPSCTQPSNEEILEYTRNNPRKRHGKGFERQINYKHLFDWKRGYFINFNAVDYSLTKSSLLLCLGESVNLSNYLKKDVGSGANGVTWSGRGVTGTTFKAEAYGTYTVTARRDFVNGTSALNLTILVPKMTIEVGAPVEVCHQQAFRKTQYNYMFGRGENPTAGDAGKDVEDGGKVYNLYFNGARFNDNTAELEKIKNNQPSNPNPLINYDKDGNYGPYVDTRLSPRTYQATLTVHVYYPKYDNKRCYFNAQKDVIIKPVPLSRTAGGDVTACQGQQDPVTLSLGASLNAETPTWHVEGLDSDKITQDGNRATADVSGLSTGKYKVTLEYYASECYSVHEKTLTVNATPGALSLPGSSLCGPGRVSLSADRIVGGRQGNNTVIWYSARQGGVEVGRLGSAIDAAASRTLWAEQRTPQGCPSQRAQDIITVHPVPQVEPFSFSRCGSESITVNLNEGNRFDGWQAQWYDRPTGGALLNDKFTFENDFTSLENYRYVTFTDPNGCSPTERVEVSFSVFPRPSKPDVPDSGVCGEGAVRFTAPQRTVSGETYVWYELPEDISPQGEGSDFETPLLTDTTTYYVGVRASAESGGCESERQQVKAFVWPVPDALTMEGVARCGAGDVPLTTDRVISGWRHDNTVVWYADEQGAETVGEAGATARADTTQVWWAAQRTPQGCVSATRAADTITVHPVPETPQLDDVVQCANPNTPVRFTVDINGEGRFDGWSAEWYELNLGGLLLKRQFDYSNIFEDPVTYRYVAFADSNGCSPPRRARMAFRIANKPNTPAIKDAGVCGGGPVVFDTPTLAQGEYVWYSLIESTSPVEDIDTEPTTFTTAALVNTDTYYVTLRVGQEDQRCESDRQEVKAFVWPIPTPIAEKTASRCGPGVVYINLDLEDEEEQIVWYSAKDEDKSVHIGDFYNTPPLDTTTTYYVRRRALTGCSSPPAAVTAQIDAITSIDIGADVSLCSEADAVLLDELLPSNIRPEQGYFVGTGVSTSNDKTYFYPNLAGVGKHNVRFEFNAANRVVYDQYCLQPGEKVFTVTKAGNVATDDLYIEADKEEAYFTDWVQFQLKDRDGNGPASLTEYQWSLGDETFSSDPAPVHYYYSAGPKTVSVTARYGKGCSFVVTSENAVNILGLRAEDQYEEPGVVTAVQADRSSSAAQVWPNPVGDRLYVRLPVKGKMDYTVYDLSGRVMLEGFFESAYGAERAVDMRSLKNGVYYLRVADRLIKLWKR